jgi:voltage-gated potassium channel
MDQPGSRALLALAAMSTVVAGGTVGFHTIEGWPYWKAFYFTIITVTTVGYGDEGLSEMGRRFTAMLLIGGIAVASYALTAGVESIVELHTRWRKRMDRKINRMAGHTIVCGYGHMGRVVATELRERGRSLVVIERSPERVELAISEGFLALQGCASEDDVLKAAAIEQAESLVAAVDVETTNIVVTLTARQLAPSLTIVARAGRDQEIPKLHRAGATRVVAPHRSFGHEVVSMLLHPTMSEFFRSRGREGALAMAEIRIEPGCPLVGVCLRDYGSGDGDHISFVALGRGDAALRIPPPGSTVLESGDVLVVAGDPDQIERMSDAAQASKQGRSGGLLRRA